VKFGTAIGVAKRHWGEDGNIRITVVIVHKCVVVTNWTTCDRRGGFWRASETLQIAQPGAELSSLAFPPHKYCGTERNWRWRSRRTTDMSTALRT